MEGQEDLVINALQNPVTGMRYHDRAFQNRMVYYGKGGITSYVKITVEFADLSCAGLGYIITAYTANNMKPGEKPEWPQK
jgi:hypothetical protein